MAPAQPEEERIATFVGPLTRQQHLVYCAAGIISCNLLWGVVQERVGATQYCDAAGEHCERFRSIPVMNVLQACAAALVAWFVMAVSPSLLAATSGAKGGAKDATVAHGATFADFFETSLCHTIASPIGYAAMAFIPYPLYVLVSSCKLIPVMAVGMLVNREARPASDYLSAATMTQGVLLYSAHQIMGGLGGGGGGGGGGGHGHGESHGHATANSSANSLFGFALDETTKIIVGIAFTLVNLTREGYTNASQDRLFKRGEKLGRPRIPGLVMMACMSAWSALLLSGFMVAQLAYAQLFTPSELEASSFLWNAGAFAVRHPEVVLHISSFSVLGAFAQVFIFTCIEHHGSFRNTVITISRKFVSVLVSVAIYGHSLDFVQWIGVVDVLVGLGIQLASGGGHGHGAAAPAHAVVATKAELVGAKSVAEEDAPAAVSEGLRKRRAS